MHSHCPVFLRHLGARQAPVCGPVIPPCALLPVVCVQSAGGPEDEDVIAERHRVNNGGAEKDVLVVKVPPPSPI